MEVILQAQASECGLACLAMAASHHGNNVGPRE
jgi:ABC-type bacteriocin/lantibiotic exporter with double-glycine peptidase domain